MNDQTTIFSKKEAQLRKIFEDIEYGNLGLPELQRPFVWGNNKVRDLFDSMYRGFPIGYFLFWENNNVFEKHRQIGKGEKQSKIPKSLIIDGQQRLTALYSVFRNKQVYDKEYKFKKIKISFNPLIERFEVANATTEKNKEYIEDISDIFTQSLLSFSKNYFKQLESYQTEVQSKKEILIKKIIEKKKPNSTDIDFIVARFNQIQEPTENQINVITKLKDKIHLQDLDEQELIQLLENQSDYDQEAIEKRIERLGNLQNYPYQALEISGDVEEEKVAEIFTRINSKGTTLNQADFVLTLISVYWDEGRKEIDSFCKACKIVPAKKSAPSPFNYVIEPDAQDIVRVIAGIGFFRGRMKDAYAILKGRDLTSRKFSEILRLEQFEVFKEAQCKVLDNLNWHNFLKIIIGLGFKSNELISSKLAVIFTYTFYLIGKYNYSCEERELQKFISKWFYMANLTSRYSSSPESQLEADLNKIKLCKTDSDFYDFIDSSCKGVLTDDFWLITLPNDFLITSSAKSPVGNTFFACLIKNNTLALFSDKKVSDLFDPALKVRKKSLDKHHLFPRKYLKEKLNFDQKARNQAANMTYLEFHDNIKIGGADPDKYFNKIKAKYYSGKENELYAVMKEHGIPDNFYEMKYNDFLIARRKMMAKIIKRGFEKL